MPRMTWNEQEVNAAIQLAYATAIRDAVEHFQKEKLNDEQVQALIETFVKPGGIKAVIAAVKRMVPLMGPHP